MLGLCVSFLKTTILRVSDHHYFGAVLFRNCVLYLPIAEARILRMFELLTSLYTGTAPAAMALTMTFLTELFVAVGYAIEKGGRLFQTLIQPFVMARSLWINYLASTAEWIISQHKTILVDCWMEKIYPIMFLALELSKVTQPKFLSSLTRVNID